jgi:sec-independent protein translocase protein TatB
MFEVGFTEIILILGIALVVLGPEKLPKVAADIGRWVGRARAMARQFKSQLDEEVIKADRDWSRPGPAGSKSRASGMQDLDASPNRVAPPPPASAPPTPAWARGEAEAEEAADAPAASSPRAGSTDSP